MSDSTADGELLKPLAQPVVAENGRRLARALNPLTGADGELLRSLADGAYLVNGFRNRDVRVKRFGDGAEAEERRRQAAQVTRLLALLKAHGLILKVQESHRYQLTAHGRRVVTALLSAHAANPEQLTAAA